jgi:hypothetical protein
MTDHATLVASATASFPAPPEHGTRINEPGHNPTPLLLLRFVEYFIECAANIPSESLLGYLGIAIEPAKFLTVNNNVPFAPPLIQGIEPSLPITATSAAAILTHQESHRQWKDTKRKYNQYKAAQAALRTLITNNVDAQFINSLSDSTTKYLLVDPMTIIKHLQTNYGEVSQEDLAENEALMNSPWDHTTPVETLFARIKECQEYAEAGEEPINDRKIIRVTYMHIKRTGIFNDACDVWDDKETASKTWSAFKTYFITAIKKKHKHTTGDTGHSERIAVANQVSSNVENMLQPYLSMITALKEEVEGMKERVNATQQHTPRGTLGDITNRDTSTTGDKPIWKIPDTKEVETKVPVDKSLIQGYSDKGGYPITYCWSCGITGNLNHHSKSCKSRKDGHKEKATLTNQLGGNPNRLVSAFHKRKAAEKLSVKE